MAGVAFERVAPLVEIQTLVVSASDPAPVTYVAKNRLDDMRRNVEPFMQRCRNRPAEIVQPSLASSRVLHCDQPEKPPSPRRIHRSRLVAPDVRCLLCRRGDDARGDVVTTSSDRSP